MICEKQQKNIYWFKVLGHCEEVMNLCALTAVRQKVTSECKTFESSACNFHTSIISWFLVCLTLTHLPSRQWYEIPHHPYSTQLFASALRDAFVFVKPVHLAILC